MYSADSWLLNVFLKTDKFFQELETTPESVLIICRWKHYDWPLWMSIKSKDEFYWSIFWPKSEYNLRKHALCSSRAGSISRSAFGNWFLIFFLWRGNIRFFSLGGKNTEILFAPICFVFFTVVSNMIALFAPTVVLYCWSLNYIFVF